MRTFNSKQTENVLKKSALSVAIATACLLGTGVAAQTAMEANATGQASSATSATVNQYNVTSDTNTGASSSIQGSVDHQQIVDTLSESGSATAEATVQTAGQASGSARQSGETMTATTQQEAEGTFRADANAEAALSAVSTTHSEDGITVDVGGMTDSALSAEIRPTDLEHLVDVFVEESVNTSAELQGSVTALLEGSTETGGDVLGGISGAVDINGEVDAWADADVQENISSDVHATAEATAEFAAETATEVAGEVRNEAEATIESAEELASETSGSVEAEAAAELMSELYADVSF